MGIGVVELALILLCGGGLVAAAIAIAAAVYFILRDRAR